MAQKLTRRQAARKYRDYERVDKTRVTDVGHKRAFSAKEEIARMVKFEIDKVTAADDERRHGTFDEEDDFEDEEPEPLFMSGFEVQDMAPDQEYEPHVPDEPDEEEPRNEGGRTGGDGDHPGDPDDRVPDKS